jgi:DNA-binding transcriptional LysR family regulator
VRSHRPPYDEAFTTLCRLSGFEPRIGFATEDYLSVQGLVAAGIGIGAAPQLALIAQRPDVVAVPIAGATPRRRIAAVRLLDARHPPAATRMLEVLRSVTKTEPSGSIVTENP